MNEIARDGPVYLPEGREAGDGVANDERLHGLGAFEPGSVATTARTARGLSPCRPARAQQAILWRHSLTASLDRSLAY